MATKIKDIRLLRFHTRLMEKALFSYLWQGIYHPMFKILGSNPTKATNSQSDLIEALRDGSIYYVDGGFKSITGKFKNVVAKELEKLGAKYSKQQKMYKINKFDLPNHLMVTISENQILSEQKIKAIQQFLLEAEKNMPYIIESLIFNDEVKIILDDMGNQITRNVRHINVIVPELDDNQLKQIQINYNTNMQFYIKKWATNRIIEMRKKVQDAVLNGYREDYVQKILEREYNIAANKAKFLARNETNIMLSEYKKATYQKMGFNWFIWSTTLDGREREWHHKLNGKVFSFDDPPIIDDATGQKGLPGEVYNCRCRLIPYKKDSVFDAV